MLGDVWVQQPYQGPIAMSPPGGGGGDGGQTWVWVGPQPWGISTMGWGVSLHSQNSPEHPTSTPQVLAGTPPSLHSHYQPHGTSWGLASRSCHHIQALLWCLQGLKSPPPPSSSPVGCGHTTARRSHSSWYQEVPPGEVAVRCGGTASAHGGIQLVPPGEALENRKTTFYWGERGSPAHTKPYTRLR